MELNISLKEIPKDKNGVEIEPFDVLKVYHYTDRKKKKHYTYKVVIQWHGALYGSHISCNPLTPGYLLDSGTSKNTEIVQSLNWKKLK